MNQGEVKGFHRALCVVLSLLLVFTLWGVRPAGPGGTPSAVDENGVPLSPPQKEEKAPVQPETAQEERAADPEDLGYKPGEIVVVFEDRATDRQVENVVDVVAIEEGSDETASAVKDEVVEEVTDLGEGTTTNIAIADDMMVEEAVEAASDMPGVRYAFPNYWAELYDGAATSSLTAAKVLSADEGAKEEWHLDFVHAPEAWETLAEVRDAKAEPIKVAVIDTGASLSHSDLKNVVNKSLSKEILHPTDNHNLGTHKCRTLVGDGYTNGSSTRTDTSGHGTHVTGIVAAESGNGGVAGVASGGSTALANKLVDVVVYDAFASADANGQAGGWLCCIVGAMEMAADEGCDVINMSLGFGPNLNEEGISALNAYCTDLQKRGVTIVCAAGNSSAEAKSYPAGCDGVISVVSVSDRNGVSSDYSFNISRWSDHAIVRSWFSNYGDWCSLSAPGEEIYSTGIKANGANYCYDNSGTSMASPVVAATAAMVKAANPDLSPVQVERVMTRTARDVNVQGKDKESGFGYVNAGKAVSLAVASRDNSDAIESAVDIEEATLEFDPAAYTGKALRPVVRIGGKTLEEGVDYEVRNLDASAVNAGDYPLVLVGRGNYFGRRECTFSIAGASLENAAVTLAAKDQRLRATGQALKPVPTVTLDGAVLTLNRDYTLTYINNVAVGTATIRVTGKGNYAGTASTTFAIVSPTAASDASTPDVADSGDAAAHSDEGTATEQPQTPAEGDRPAGGQTEPEVEPAPDPTPEVSAKPQTPANPKPAVPKVTTKSLATASIGGLLSSYNFTGKVVHPVPSVVVAGQRLAFGTDYTVGWSAGCAAPGTYTVTVYGKGRWTGRVSRTFVVKAPAVARPSAKAPAKAKRAFTARWSKVRGNVSGYQVQYSLNKKFTKSVKTKTASAKKTSLKISKLGSKRTYYVHIRAYYRTGGMTFYSPWSATTSVRTR